MSITTKKVLSAIGSGVVILCFFLPWDRWFTGLGYLLRTFRALELARYDSGVPFWTPVGWVILLTPVVCHIISLIITLVRRPSVTLALIPAAVWALALILGSAKVGRYFSLVSDFAGVGSVGTLIGIIFTNVINLIKTTAPVSGYQQPVRIPAPVFCTQCGCQLSPGSRFCISCGTQIQPGIPVCLCGARLKPSARFCTICGRKTG